MDNRGICSVEDCDKPARGAVGYCEAHYRRWKKDGDAFDRGPVKKRAKHGDIPDLLESLIALDCDECAPWPYSKTAGGYGECYVDGYHWLVHRYVCTMVHGAPPSLAHEAAHSCHAPDCANPKHLRWATPLQNSADKTARGTTPRGEAHVNAKLSAESVLEIRKLLAGPDPNLAQIGNHFGVSHTLIRRIKNGKAWGWLKSSQVSQ